jgi:hypothetical protein
MQRRREVLKQYCYPIQNKLANDDDDSRHGLVVVVDDAKVLGHVDAHVDDFLLDEVDAHGDHSQA